jgi:hypothetical protein
MKRNIKILFSFFLLAILLVNGCKKELNKPIDDNPNAPQPITNPVVKNIAGGAVISYTLPEDANLLYVKAVYERNGETVASKASYFRNNIIVEGLGDTVEQNVVLYAVSRSEVPSEPVNVKINPLAPAISGVLKSLDIVESFGGMSIKFLNPAPTSSAPNNIVIGILMWDTRLSEWVDVDAYYTGLESGVFSVRGLESVEQKFGFFVKDTWGNRTDTIEKILTPIYEEELDVSKIKYVKGKYPVPQKAPLPTTGDPVLEPGNLSSWPFDNLFDGEIGNSGFHTNERNPVPIWIPMDLGVTAQLSRYKIWQRMHDNNSTYFYSHGNPHEWEIWGTNTPNDPDSWQLLDHRVMVKPSGLPIGQVTNDDVEIARLGHEYEFPIGTPAVRYIAWKHIDSWASIDGSTGFLHMSEMKLWGQIK